jgi:hypothetical protein
MKCEEVALPVCSMKRALWIMAELGVKRLKLLSHSSHEEVMTKAGPNGLVQLFGVKVGYALMGGIA